MGKDDQDQADGGQHGGQDGGQQDTEAQRLDSLEKAQGEMRREQTEQRGILDKILGHVSSGADVEPGGAGDSGRPALGDIAGQVRAEIDAAEQRRRDEAAGEADKTWRRGVDEALEVLKLERAPREPQSGVRGALQRAFMGRDS